MKELVAKLEALKSSVDECLRIAKSGRIDEEPALPQGEDEGDESSDSPDIAKQLGFLALKSKLAK